MPVNSTSHYATLNALFDEACAKHASQAAFCSFGTSLSYSDLKQEADSFAAYLRSLDTLERGDRVAIMLPNLLQCPIALFGILKAGFVASSINPLYSTRELKHQLRDSGAKAIVIVEPMQATLIDVIADTEIRHVVVTGVGRSARRAKIAADQCIDALPQKRLHLCRPA